MTSQGSAYSRFQRAVATGNPLLIDAAARELPQLSLDDAFAVCLAFVDDVERYERAAVRWHARYCLEKRPGAQEAALVLAALQALAGPVAGAGAGALLEVFTARGLRRAGEVLERFAAAREP